MRRLGNPVGKHSYREQTRVANLLALRKVLREMHFGRTNVLAVPPMFVMDAVWADILGTMFCRTNGHYDNYNGSSLAIASTM